MLIFFCSTGGMEGWSGSNVGREGRKIAILGVTDGEVGVDNYVSN